MCSLLNAMCLRAFNGGTVQNENKIKLCIHMLTKQEHIANKVSIQHFSLSIFYWANNVHMYKDPQSPIAWSIQYTTLYAPYYTTNNSSSPAERIIESKKIPKNVFHVSCVENDFFVIVVVSCEEGFGGKKNMTKCIKLNERLIEPNEQWTKMRIKTEWQLCHKWNVWKNGHNLWGTNVWL